MTRPSKLEPSVVHAWVASHAGWATQGETLVRTFVLPDFASALALAVRIGMIAEKRDHHPDLRLGWGKLGVVWSTHDAGGITQLDLDLAVATDTVAGT